MRLLARANGNRKKERNDASRLPDSISRPNSQLTSAIESAEQVLLPAWRAVSLPENRWPAMAAIAVAIVLQLLLPEHLTLGRHWIVPASEGVFLLALTVLNPGRIRHRAFVRELSLLLIASMSIANICSTYRLIRGLVGGTEGANPRNLLVAGGTIWLINVLVFTLWYWEFDRGGPAERAVGSDPYPDFVFPQMSAPDLAPKDWQPNFVDYLYLSFTNATAFSPTDALPYSRWAKMTMMVQSAVSLVTVGLVIARAVNILH